MTTPASTTTRKPRTRKPAAPKPQTGSELIKALEIAWRSIMKRHPELPDVVMITGSGADGLGLTWAHFWRERWTDKADKTTRPELFISGERMACGAALTLQSMLHEAAHAIAFVREIQDCSRQNRYHNGEFRKIAEELGLEYTHDGPDKTIGFSAVTMTEKATAEYAKEITALDKAIKIELPGFGYLATGGSGTTTGGDGGHRVTGLKIKPTTGTSRNNIKITCQCEQPRIIRISRKTFEIAGITCEACGSKFEEA